ncbi:type II secretion system F family protein [Pontibacterium sp. N1Y112]|uniref:Type II secretion system F family protein n=2 Tax=Pontibacterium TaxID=2036025 RepID=A0A8J7FJ87_9GAMM|nr:type II secretion system F family protein [Pontibacterium sinense]MBE9398858.1 type II secretion system F family protein [Pontibacterium sinense]
MAKYRYKALDARGQEKKGNVEAASPAEATALLRSRSLHVLKVELASSFNPLRLLAMLRRSLSPKRYAGISSGDLVMTFRQLALMLRAGNTLIQGLELCSEMTEKVQLRNTLINVLVAIQGGSSFAAAIQKQGTRFPPLVAKLVASGEASGELQATLERLAESLERSAALKRQFISAMTYPMFLLVASVGVTLFLTLSIIPKFATLLEGRSQDLPGATQAMMNISTWLVDYGLYLAIVLGIGLFLTLASYTTVLGKSVIDRILLHVPMVGHSIRTSAMSQMGWTMSLLLSSGLTVLESLRVVSDIMANKRLSTCFQQAGDEILAGRSLAYGLKQNNIPPMVQHMAGIGERSGELEHVMRELGKYYQEMAEARIKRMISTMEPAMTVIVAGQVGFVYYAFFKAMMQVSAG